MGKVRLKMAEIRTNEDAACPYGLPIPFGCKNAGRHTQKMAPFSVMGKDVSADEKEMIGQANTKLLAWSLLRDGEPPAQCKYVGHLLGDRDMVECNFDDSAPGQGPGQPLLTAPFYSKMFSGVINGLNTYPAGYYSDYDVSRNMYLGNYSLQGAERKDFLKMAAEEIELRSKYTNNSE